MKTQYFHFSNDFKGKSGIVTLAAKSNGEKKEVIKVGFALTPPDSKFDKEKAKKEALKVMESNQCSVMVGRASTGKMGDTARLVWGSAILTCYDLPKWAKKLDLGMKAHVIK